MSCFQITLDLCGFGAKPHQRSCCLSFCVLCSGCRTQVTRAGKVLLLVQLFLLTWTAVKRAGSRTAPDLKEGSKADLAEGKKHRQVSWLGGGKSEERARSTNKANGSLEAGPGPGRTELSHQPRHGLVPKAERGICRQRGQQRGMMQMNATFFWLKFGCYSRLGMLPCAIVNLLF